MEELLYSSGLLLWDSQMKTQKLLGAAVFGTAMLLTSHAMAQSGGARDRLRAEKCYSTEGKPVDCEQQSKSAAPAVAEKYPNATRIAPEAPKTKIKKEWDALVKASNGNDANALIAAGEAVLNHAEASLNEKSEAANQVAQAYLRQRQDNYVKPIQYAKQAVDLGGLSNNTHYMLMLTLGQMLVAEKRYDEAVAYLERFSSETRVADDLTLLKNKGNAYYRLAKYPEAIASLEKAYAIDKGADANIAVMLMDAYNKSGRKADANRLADEVAKAAAASGDPGAESKQLLVYANAKQYEKAAQAFDVLYAKGQIATLAEYEAGYVSYSYLEGKEAQAIKIINEGIAKGVIKPDAAVYNILGQSYYYSGNAAGAIDAWGKGAALSKDGEQDLLLARVLGEESEYAKSKAAAQLALSKGVQSKGDAYLIIAEAESEFGLDNRTAMISALKEAAKYPETQAEARKRLKQAGGN